MASAELQIPEHIQETQNITREELEMILHTQNPLVTEELRRRAQQTAKAIYGNKIYVRGLIEFTNYCKNNCYYCGIRCSNTDADRYRLSLEQILSCCETGWNLGFRTFVLQGGEDPHFTDEHICQIVRTIKEIYPDCAVTLSIGEKSEESYQAYFNAGADRYLLRHETADEDHYKKLHPEQMSLVFRKNCLKNLKKIGYQTGCGFMVGSPGQTVDTRLIHPHALLPATTALGTIDPKGREKGILAGANVVMPNLSPVNVRDKYTLYDNKICTGDEAAECKACMAARMKSIGYEVVTDRGDYKA